PAPWRRSSCWSGWSALSRLSKRASRRRAPPRRSALDDEQDLLPLHRRLVQHRDLDRAVFGELHVQLALLLEVRREDADVANPVDAELARLEGDRLGRLEVD